MPQNAEPEELTTTEKVVKVVKAVAPPVLTVALTVVASVSAAVISKAITDRMEPPTK
jgi:hypothetical protein